MKRTLVGAVLCTVMGCAAPEPGGNAGEESTEDGGSTDEEDGSSTDEGTEEETGDTEDATEDGGALDMATCDDQDGDGYGEGAACIGPDCDDTDPLINPAAFEICDTVDNDCDGEDDPGIGDLSKPDPDSQVPDIYSLHLLNDPTHVLEGQALESGVILDLLHTLTTTTDVDDVVTTFGADVDPDGRPAFTEGDVCLLATDLEYLLTVFPKMPESHSVAVPPGSKLFEDEFAFQFVTDEPELYEPLPFDTEHDAVIYAGEGTALGEDEEVPQFEIIVRGRRWLIDMSGTL